MKHEVVVKGVDSTFMHGNKSQKDELITYQISNLMVVSSKATVWVRNAAPIVGSWNSKNSSRTNRTTKHDLPTAVSPNNTNLKWCMRVFVLLLLAGCFINILLLLFMLYYCFPRYLMLFDAFVHRNVLSRYFLHLRLLLAWDNGITITNNLL